MGQLKRLRPMGAGLDRRANRATDWIYTAKS